MVPGDGHTERNVAMIAMGIKVFSDYLRIDQATPCDDEIYMGFSPFFVVESRSPRVVH